MGKSRNYDREYDLLDKLKKENAQLKRDYAKLRRQVDRLNLDNDRYRTLKELVHKQAKEEQKSAKTRKDWTCFDCGKGTMKLHLLIRRDGTYYYRLCSLSECGNRTKLKKHTSEVEES